jgi:hypothetical protein
MPPPSRRYHLILDADLKALYESRLPNGPAFGTLTESQKAEFRLFVETKGVVWNPRWGMVGRMNAYGAFREFTLEENDVALEDPEIEDPEIEKEIRARTAAKIHGTRATSAGGVTIDPAEAEAKAKIRKLQRLWATLTESEEERPQPVRELFPSEPGDPPGSWRIKTMKLNPETGKKEEERTLIRPLSRKKEAIIDQIQAILLPFVKKSVARTLDNPKYRGLQDQAEEIADKVVVDWSFKVRQVENAIEDGSAPAHASEVAGSYKTPKGRETQHPDEFFQSYRDANPDRTTYPDIIRDVMSRIGKVIGNEINKSKRAGKFTSDQPVSTSGELSDEGEEAEVIAKAPEDEITDAPDIDDKFSAFKEIENALRTYPKEYKLFKALIGTTGDFQTAGLKLGWDRAKTIDVLKSLRAAIHKEVPEHSDIFARLRESKKYSSLARLLFPNLCIQEVRPLGVTYSTYRKFDLI